MKEGLVMDTKQIVVPHYAGPRHVQYKTFFQTNWRFKNLCSKWDKTQHKKNEYLDQMVWHFCDVTSQIYIIAVLHNKNRLLSVWLIEN